MTIKFNHRATPAPWRVIPTREFDGKYYVVIAEGNGEYVIADRAVFHKEQMPHNLQLIAQAHSLLTALEALVAACGPDAIPHDREIALRVAEIALEDATGRGV